MYDINYFFMEWKQSMHDIFKKFVWLGPHIQLRMNVQMYYETRSFYKMLYLGLFHLKGQVRYEE
jgi:hypothetical protein